jgi:hypothetical protein
MIRAMKKSEKTFKYRLHYLLRKLSIEDYEVAMKFLPEKLGVSLPTFKRWIYARETDNQEISGCHLMVLAAFFEVTFEELFTNPPKVSSKSEVLNQSA